MTAKDMFLVTYDGERHEDHIPHEIITYENLIKKYEVSQSLEELKTKLQWFFITDENGRNVNIIYISQPGKIPRT